MTPDEVIEQLKKIGIEISRPTLTRYEKQGLIPNPKRGGLGRGGGRWTDYPDNTIEEAYASWQLMHGEYGTNEVNNDFFNGKPPKINPLTVANVRSWNEMRKKINKSELECQRSEADNAIRKAMRKVEGENIEILKQLSGVYKKVDAFVAANTNEDLIGNGQEKTAYSRLVEPLKNFVRNAWIFEINEARKKINAIG